MNREHYNFMACNYYRVSEDLKAKGDDLLRIASVLAQYGDVLSEQAAAHEPTQEQTTEQSPAGEDGAAANGGGSR